MKNEFLNRLGMGRTVLTTLDKPAHLPVWKDQPPVAFTTKVSLLRPMITKLGDLVRDQEAIITGFAEAKEDDQQTLEDLAHEIGGALASYADDHGRADLSAEVDFSISSWRRLRDASLLGRAKLVHERLVTALAADAAKLVTYGLDAADATDLQTAIAEYEGIINSPQAATANRKSLTKVLRPRFRELSELLGGMDKLVLRFRKTEAGRTFAAAWTAARVVRDLGAGPSETPTPPPLV